VSFGFAPGDGRIQLGDAAYRSHGPTAESEGPTMSPFWLIWLVFLFMFLEKTS